MNECNTIEYTKKSEVYKTQDFESYVIWKSLPSFLKGQPKQVLEKYGINEDLLMELLEIKSQKEFAQRFTIKDPGTLTDWNKRIEKEGSKTWISTKSYCGSTKKGD